MPGPGTGPRPGGWETLGYAAHPASYSVGSGDTFRMINGRGVNLTTRHLVLTLRMSVAIALPQMICGSASRILYLPDVHRHNFTLHSPPYSCFMLYIEFQVARIQHTFWSCLHHTEGRAGLFRATCDKQWNFVRISV